MKKIFLFILVLFTSMNVAKASTINSITTDVYLDENGNGHVTEVWNIYTNEGTESYHSFGNMDGREITDFEVSMDGTSYESEYEWDINRSKEEKAYKNGINYTSDGLELCWGIEYGTHTYTLNYTIENLVWQYTDSQVLYFSFLPQNMRQAPQEYKLTFKSFTPFQNIKYSSYGFVSENNLNESEITMEGTNLSSSDYVVALIAFPNGTFSLSNQVDETYEEVRNEALEGATLNGSSTVDLLGILMTIAIPVIVIIMILKITNNYDKTEFIIPKNVPYFRDIPFDKNILKSYFIGYEEGIMKQSNIMGAILLKWLKEGKITIVKLPDTLFNKNNFYIDLTNLQNVENNSEKNLADMLKLNAINNQITPKDFSKYCKKHYELINKWLDNASLESKTMLMNENYIVKNEKNKLKFTSKLAEEYIKLKGLKEFLNNMSLMNEKEAIEVHMWDEYLIFAEAFGIADKVAKQLKEFHPEYTQINDYCDYCIMLHTFSYNSYSSAKSAQSAADSGGSFSGGGSSSGGFSSGGGGVR